MDRLFSNGPSKDFVLNPFNRLVLNSSRLYLAAPYFTAGDAVRDAVKAGKSVQLSRAAAPPSTGRKERRGAGLHADVLAQPDPAGLHVHRYDAATRTGDRGGVN